ncbi:MAG TPA: hypothetical protein VGI16_04450 [Candidatus Acidoferrum sp.]|jgi:hypothetical protein
MTTLGEDVDCDDGRLLLAVEKGAGILRPYKWFGTARIKARCDGA